MCASILMPLFHPIGDMAMWVPVGVGVRRATIIFRGSAAPIGYLYGNSLIPTKNPNVAQPRTPRAMMAGLTTSLLAVHCGRGRMAMFYRMAIYRNQERS